MERGTDLVTIGELAARTGVPVRTIRFYSDAGLVAPTTRSAAGYRLYDAEAATRLQLLRTLRELDIDLATAAQVLRRETTLADVASAHAEALRAQARVMNLRAAVLRAVAARDCDWREMELMHRLARLDANERRRIVDGFLTEVFGGLETDDRSFEEMMRASFPDLPESPTPRQVDAWVELLELVQDEGFRARTRQMAVRGAQMRAAGDEAAAREQAAHGGAMVALMDGAQQAVADGVDPSSAEGGAVLGALMERWADAVGQEDTPRSRTDLADEIEMFTDRRVERYWQLVGIVGGHAWPSQPAGPGEGCAPEAAGERQPEQGGREHGEFDQGPEQEGPEQGGPEQGRVDGDRPVGDVSGVAAAEWLIAALRAHS
ncbi:MerR family transcriptional regulator [Allostreptomyces psammosilenae]|uniref:DNA-binding transcriptional MerR regulator n=1 Tax=Allostreptomyces psammosilenae TaxID=1892865 RepID=A0A852ZVH5_9ACTN|nr:MerR family transcriptional regulator [Allostreptomyces psammosilenae]NYI06393.1 DNA-binding transcriptional MerR regulator [Allostreptomyces psammosilenae]